MGVPVVRTLTDKQAAFVEKILLPGVNPTEAARLAGYSAAAVEGWRLIRLPHVVDAIQQERAARIEVEGGNKAYATLMDCMEPKYSGTVRVAAAKIMATMAGMLKAENGIADKKDLQTMSADELEQQLAKIDQALASKAEAAKPISATVRDDSAAS